MSVAWPDKITDSFFSRFTGVEKVTCWGGDIWEVAWESYLGQEKFLSLLHSRYKSLCFCIEGDPREHPDFCCNSLQFIRKQGDGMCWVKTTDKTSFSKLINALVTGTWASFAYKNVSYNIDVDFRWDVEALYHSPRRLALIAKEYVPDFAIVPWHDSDYWLCWISG